MNDLEPVEQHLRDEHLEPGAHLVVRGWPLTVDGLLRNADATRSRFSWNGAPLIAVSAEVTVEAWNLDAILAGSRLRTRSRYATAAVSALLEAGLDLLPTFAQPHYSIVLAAYDEATAQQLLRMLGEVRRNPYYVGR